MRSLSHRGLPAFADEYQTEDCACVVRQYIPGASLRARMDGRALSPGEAASVAAALLDILAYLHAQTPSVIHRDIKPQNIILTPDGGAALIDFECARTYEEGARADTRCVGTRAYAPPEQYGFSQTDCRADLYSLGVVLREMLTGAVDGGDIQNPRLRKVVSRLTAFAPEKRYPRAADAKRALLRAVRARASAGKRALACALAALLFCAGFALGHFARFYAREADVRFKEPLIERAARAQLGLGAGERLTRESLLGVRALYIFGDAVSNSQEAFFSGLNGWTGPRGGIQSLEDVRFMPNLEVLFVNYQTLSDIAPIASLQSLRYLDLRHTFARDVSPLAGLNGLEIVSLFDTNARDLSPLADCPRLRELDVGRTRITSLAQIPDLYGLSRLCLRDLPLADIAGIDRFSSLAWLCLSGTGARDLSPLLALKQLRELLADTSLRAPLAALGETAFEIAFEEN